MFAVIEDGSYACRKCSHKCQSWNQGGAFAVNAQGSGGSSFIWVNEGEYAPCGIRLKQITNDLDHSKSEVQYLIRLIGTEDYYAENVPCGTTRTGATRLSEEEAKSFIEQSAARNKGKAKVEMVVTPNS